VGIDFWLNIGDLILIAPYRWLANPAWGWWLGTFILGLWCSLLGELTMAVAMWLNREPIRQVLSDTARRHNQSMRALKAGDGQAYKGINKLANEAFGKAFFLQLAMGMGSLWPAFLAAAWLQARFAGLEIPLPLVGWQVGYIPGFLVMYLLSRVIFSRLKRRIPFFKRTLALARSLAPEERLELLGPPPKKKEDPDIPVAPGS